MCVCIYVYIYIYIYNFLKLVVRAHCLQTDGFKHSYLYLSIGSLKVERNVRNGYCKRVITSTAESKRVFF